MKKIIRNESIDEGKKNFDSLFENAPDAMLIADIETGYILHANKTACNLFLLPLDKLIGMHQSQLHPASNNKITEETFHQHIEQTTQNETTTLIENFIVKSDGSKVQVEILASRIEYNGKQCIIGTFRDISERKKLEQFKKQQEQLNTVILQNAMDGFWIVDLLGRFKEVNKAYCDIIGYTRDELLSMSVKDVEVIDSTIEIKKRIERLKEKGNERFISKHICKNGNIIDVDVSIHYLIHEQLLFVFIQDITERKQSELLIKEAEVKYRTVADFTYDWEIWISPNLEFIYCSPSCKRITGYDANEFYSDHSLFRRLIHKDYRRNWDEHLKINQLKQCDETLEFIIIDKNGKEKWIEHLCTPVFDKSGVFIGRRGSNREITERKLTEESLRESDVRFQKLIEQAGDGFELINENGQYVDVNETSCKQLGYTKEELLSLTIADIDPSVTIEKYKEQFNSLINSQPITFESHHKRKDGICFPVEISASVIKLKKGYKSLALVRDISERKKAEKNMHHYHELMKYIIEHTRSAVAVHDRNFNYIYVSQKYLQDYNVKEKNIIGKHHYEVFPDLPQKWRDVHQLALKGIVSSGEDDPYYRDDGTVEWTRWECRPWYESDENIGGIIVYTEVITERKKAELRLIQSEERFKRIVETAEGLFYRQKIDSGQFEYVSPKVEKILGYKIDEFLSFDIEEQKEKIHPDDFCHIENFVSDLFEADKNNNNHIEREFRFKKKSGEYCWVHGSYALIKDENNLPNMIIGNLIDITEKKNADLELLAHRFHLQELVDERTDEMRTINTQLIEEIELKELAQKQLAESLEKEKELNKLKSRFVSTASHEFRTPLASILSSVELLQRYSNKWDEEKKDTYIEKVKTSVEYLTKLMDDVITVNRSDAGKSIFAPSMCNLKKICTNIIEEIELNALGSYTFYFNYIPIEENFYLDTKQIQIILFNLLSNAVKYSPSGGNIQLDVQKSNRDIKIIVKDEGIGIPKDDIPKLFESFFRAQNAYEIRGTGLGLHIVKSSVEMHGGAIEVESQEGSGTTFTVSIPITV